MNLNKRINSVCGLATIVLLITACNNGNNRQPEAGAPATEDTAVVKKEAPEQHAEPFVIRYHAYPLKGVDSAVKVFKKQYTPEQQWAILALNRLDVNNIWRPDTLIIPDTLLEDFNAYSPFPAEAPILKDVNKIAIFSYPIQAFAAYEKGKLVYWGPTSMGSKIHPTPAGLHFANWKAKETISTVNDEWKLKWNFNIENKEGVGWHQYTMPGYPASHSCLRMLEAQAKWMYTWAEQWIVKNDMVAGQGTPVIVFGAYPFGTRRPWRNMLEDPNANRITEQTLEQEVQPHLDRILEQQQRRQNALQGTPLTATTDSTATHG